MSAHVRANLVLVAGTLLLCCVAYPLVLLGVGRVVFPGNAAGSLVVGPDGRVVGSSRVAQSFAGDGYFRPRPSAVAYNAAGSGGSNWGASNPKLRDRAARLLGPVVRFATPTGRDADGKTVQERIDEWLRDNPGLLGGATRDLPAAERHAAFFDAWLRAHPDVRLEPVPADLVTASGSGLDPHITLANARYQGRRVAAARARHSGADPVRVRQAVDDLLARHAAAPLGGLVGGEPLVNVLEVNLALDRELPRLAAATARRFRRRPTG